MQWLNNRRRTMSHPPMGPIITTFSITEYGSILSLAYSVEVGMTWEDWVSSSYNTGSFSKVECIRIAKGKTGRSFNVVFYNDASTMVNSYDTIDPNEAYWIKTTPLAPCLEL